MLNNYFSTSLLSVTLLCTASAQAEIYKWIDINRIVNYSDSAPETGPSQILDLSKKRMSALHQKLLSTIHLVGENKQSSATDEKIYPDLSTQEYSLRNPSKKPQRKIIKNVKKKLCNEKRMLLAALQETGFNSYYDEEGHYRLAWGGDGLYQGKRRFLNGEDVIKKTADVIFEIKQYCDDPSNQALQEAARANWIRSEYCTVSKAVLEDLEHPFMRATDSKIRQQRIEVARLCNKQVPRKFRNDERYYPKALRAKMVLPRHLILLEE